MNTLTRRFGATVAIAATLGATAVGCSRQGSTASNADSLNTNEQLGVLQRVQPTPKFQWSQYRQTLIDIETAEANGTATTTFFMSNVGTPISQCASLGFPVPITSQLTSPTQIQYGNHPGGGNDAEVTDQSEPTGTYTGASTGTYVTCVDPAGKKYYQYWEGYVDTVGGAAHWDGKQILLDGPATVKVGEK